MTPNRAAAARAIDDFLKALGRTEPDLVGTGERVADAFLGELLTGYGVDTRQLLEVAAIDEEASAVVVVRAIPVVTICPHHLLVAMGTADVAFAPGARVVGLGTLVAVVDAHARRLTLQERIAEGVVTDVEAVLAPLWVACRVSLTHGCMVARGERAIGARVETLAVRGADVASAHAAVGWGKT